MRSFVYYLFATCILFASCSRDDSSAKLCTEEWNVMEYCTRTAGCPVVGCGESPTYVNRTFKCEEVNGIKEGDLILYKTESSCAKFYRKFIKKMK